MDIWIGTSGYSYSSWVGDFYPPGTNSNRMLPYYSRHFPLVELNFTFYRTPTPEMLRKIARQTPPGFRFVVKLPQTISHDESPNDIPAFGKAVEEMARHGKLMGLLHQMPQKIHHTARSEKWLERVAHDLGDLRLAVEFRHRSWLHTELTDWLGDLGLDLVSVDVPDMKALFPRGLMWSGSRLYVRLHSRNAEAWYTDDASRYDYNYTDEQLSAWISALPQGGPEEALFLFNNCQRSQAVINARRMRALFEEQAAQFNVVAPFAEAPPVQRSLFE
jgi:uncharacterized protein YecE (DUF72 family)